MVEPLVVPDVSFTSLLVVSVVALLAPLTLGFFPSIRLPAVVLEITLGVLLGPAVLGWITIDLPVQVLAILGLAMLLFLSGLEIDARSLRGPLLRAAVVGYAITLALGVPIGFGLERVGWVSSPLLVVIALSATSLGLVIPVLKDAGLSTSRVGQAIIVASTFADVAAIVLLSVLFSAAEGGAAERVVTVAGFVLVAVIAVIALGGIGRWRRLGSVLERLQDTTAEIRIRAAIVLMIGFVAMAETLGLEIILGAFLAGVVVSLIDRDAPSHPHFRIKLEAVGFGFLVPVFFISSGAELDVAGLIAEPSSLVRVPVFLLALLVMRAVPAIVYISSLGRKPAAAAGLLQATSLPFIVAATAIGQELGMLSPLTAAAMVMAGLLSVLIFPASAVSLLRVRPLVGPAEPTAGG